MWITAPHAAQPTATVRVWVLFFQRTAGCELELWMRPTDEVGRVAELLHVLGASSKVRLTAQSTTDCSAQQAELSCCCSWAVHPVKEAEA